MSDRSVSTVVEPSPIAGMGVLRPFPSAELRQIDPFVFLDTGAPLHLGNRDIYVGPHPHKGVAPISVLFRGRIEHRDSLGNHEAMTSGGIQWLTAGRGALHEEVLGADEEGVFHMAQLWLNLPSALKTTPAEHRAINGGAVPEIRMDGGSLRLYSGTVDGVTGPAELPVPALITHARITGGGTLRVPIPTNWRAGATVVAGSVGAADGAQLGPGGTTVFSDEGDSVAFASLDGGELFIYAGTPLEEPVAMGGGFVMNSRDELVAADAEVLAGRFGELPASR